MVQTGYLDRWTGWMAMAIVMVLMTACNELDEFNAGGELGEDEREKRPLELIMLQDNIEEEKVYWWDGCKAGLYLVKDSIGNTYDDNKDVYDNIRAQFLNGIWFFDDKTVPLKEEYANVYAYIPYKAVSDPKAVYVETKSNTQYLYGSLQYRDSLVNCYNPIARMMMKHAMAMIDIRIRKQDFDKQVSCTYIGLNRKDSIGFPIQGTMDITTGDITPTHYGNHYALDGVWVLKDEFTKDNRVCWTAIPQDLQQDMTEIVCSIGEKTFRIPLDAEKDWVKGYQSIYNLTFTGKYLYIESVEIKPWVNVHIDMTITDQDFGG